MQKRELRRAVFGDESCIGRLPWLNTAVLVYVGVTVVSFVLLQIAPVLTWMAKTPLYHISTYLGLIGAVLMALVSLPSNYFVVYPAYEVLYGLPMTGIIGMYEAIMGSIAHVPTGNSLFNCLLVFNVPFTLFKGLLDVGICFLIYKPLSPLLHK